MKKIIKFFKEIYTQMCTKNGKFYPPYIYIWMLLSLVFMIVIFKEFQIKEISDQHVKDMCDFVAVWLGIVTAGDTIKGFIK